MLQIRSLAFNIVFYVNLIVQMILWTPFYFLSPRQRAWFVPKFWARSSLWLLREDRRHAAARSRARKTCPKAPSSWRPSTSRSGTRSPSSPIFHDPLYILKRELTWIPFFGWYIMKMRMIPVNRGSRSKALKAVVAATKAETGAQSAPAHHLSRRHAPRARRRAGLQIRHRRTLHAARPAGGAGRPCRRAVLAAPQVPALSRHHPGALPAADPARASARRNSWRG